MSVQAGSSQDDDRRGRLLADQRSASPQLATPARGCGASSDPLAPVDEKTGSTDSPLSSSPSPATAEAVEGCGARGTVVEQADAGVPAADWVDARGMHAWRNLLRAHAQVTRVLEAELDEEHGLPLASYDVLVQLSEAPDGALRMSDLADAVLLSRSGLTRLVDRLVREGLVERRSCPSDLRGTLAVITPTGLTRLCAASGTHLRGVARHVLAHYSPAELELLGDLLGRLASPATEAGTCGQ